MGITPNAEMGCVQGDEKSDYCRAAKMVAMLQQSSADADKTMAEIFDSYDKDKTGFIEESELEAVLLDMLKAKALAQKQRNEKVLNGDEANWVAVREIVKNGKDPLVAAKEL